MRFDSRALLTALADEPASSGNALAQRFGVTRAAIWKQIEQLRSLGVPITAQAREGYRLGRSIDLLDAECISAAMRARYPDQSCPIDVRWQIDSTNSEMLRLAPSHNGNLAACFSELQSAGRGRRGRSWHMPLGGGLAFSILRRFESSMAALAGLSLAVGIGVVRGLADLGIAGSRIKWPNDIQAQDRKLAGILIELGGDSLGPCHAVIGIGINVHLDAQASECIDQPWIDLASISTQSLDRNQLAGRVLGSVLDVLDQFAASGFAPLVDEFALFDALMGRQVRILHGRDQREGTAAGVDQSGRLRVRTADGEILVDSGEVSVRTINGASP
ncbi:MAG: biotin--[acetyl-CoA-carboxylase] ligase [Dokdonella sp.]